MSDFIIEEIKKTVDRNKKWQPKLQTLQINYIHKSLLHKILV